MLPKGSRLPYQIQKNVRRGQRESLPELELVLIPAINISRWTFQIPKKLVKLAVRRNRIKRLLSEAVFSLSPGVKFTSDNILKVKKDLSGLRLDEIKNLVEVLFKKAKLI